MAFYSHREEDEPLKEGSPIDYLHLMQTLIKVSDDERDRLERIEGKIAVVVAGAFAAMGFSLDKATTSTDIIMAAAYAIPVVVLLIALLPTKYQGAPDAEVYRTSFPTWPIASWKAACDALTALHKTNAPKIEGKASLLRAGIIALIVVTVALVSAKAYESLHGVSIGEQRTAIVGPNAKSSGATVRCTNPHTPQTRGRVNDLRSAKGATSH